MAELTILEEKLAEVVGLAQAVQTATKKVATLARKEKETELLELMRQMGDDAAKVVGFMNTYLEDAEALDGLEFLSMAEAGEMAHWEILAKLNETASDTDIAGVIKFAVPLHPYTSTPSASTPCDSPATRTLRTCLAATR